MSVYSRIFTGWTVEILNSVTHSDFAHFHSFIDEHPELDEYSHQDFTGKTLLIVDGMNGHYLRLIKVDACQNYSSCSTRDQMIELQTPELSLELFEEFNQIYQKYTGNELKPEQVKYTMWTQWY